MRTKLAIQRQLTVVNTAVRKWPDGDPNDSFSWGHATGMQQALAWMLDDNTASPRACLAHSKDATESGETMKTIEEKLIALGFTKQYGDAPFVDKQLATSQQQRLHALLDAHAALSGLATEMRADPEALPKARAAVSENECLWATRSFWGFSLRKAIARGDLEAVKAETARAEAVTKQWIEDSHALGAAKAQVAMLREALETASGASSTYISWTAVKGIVDDVLAATTDASAWLAEHDAKVRVAAWNEGRKAGIESMRPLMHDQRRLGAEESTARIEQLTGLLLRSRTLAESMWPHTPQCAYSQGGHASNDCTCGASQLRQDIADAFGICVDCGGDAAKCSTGELARVALAALAPSGNEHDPLCESLRPFPSTERAACNCASLPVAPSGDGSGA